MLFSHATTADLIQAQAAVRPDKIAYIFDDHQYTWKEVNDFSDQIALSLHKMGIRQGDKVALWGVNTFDWILCFFGVQKIGAIAVLVNYSYKDCEASYIFNHTDVSFLLIGEPKSNLDYNGILSRISSALPHLKKSMNMKDLVSGSNHRISAEDKIWLLDRLAAIAPDDVACIIFTSGTTSRPKGVQLMHHNLVNNAAVISQHMGWTSEDCQLLPLPFFHGSGMVPGIMCGAYTGMSAVILRTFQSVPALEAMQKYRCTIFSAVPSMLMIMIHNKNFSSYDISSYRSGIVSGSSILPEMYLKICEALRVENLQMAYGQTETSPLITISALSDSLECKSVTVGKPLAGIPIRVWDNDHQRNCTPSEAGEIQVFGNTIMKGYYRQTELTEKKFTPDGWWKTDDVGFFDMEGYLHFCGRNDDMIIRGGENISPREIEESICRFSDKLTDIKVVGVPSAIVQEDVAALVVGKDGYKVNPDELRSYIKARMANFKVPKYIFQLDAFPLTSNGKPDSKQLKALAAELVEKIESCNK